MTPPKYPLLAALPILAFALTAAAASAQTQIGKVEFSAVVTPASGHPEPVRGQMIYLLRSSFEQIRKRAESEEAKPDLDKFIDGLKLSDELKAWMKRQRTTTIIGEPFHKMLTSDDLINVPEFLNAYVEANLTEAEADVGFPKPKFREKDKIAKPAKYEQDRKAYYDALHKYYEKNRQSADTIDAYLEELDHTQAWERLMADWKQRVYERAVQDAQAREFVAKVETDLEGRGAFEVPPGTYWITTLEGQALAGEKHLHWDLALVVEAGRITRVELSNVNAERTR